MRRAVDLTGCAVAVKAFKPQAEKEVGREALQKRFQREVKAFHDIGIGPGSKEGAQEIDPRGYFVNLLDFSGFDSSPPPSVNCRCYTVLEIGDQSLDDWLQRGAVSLSGFCELAKALFKALKWLHGLGFIHMDVKPENIMRFGTRWKLIDLDCCMSCNDEMVTPENFTPLYASPELAREVLDTLEMDNPATRKRPCPAMDIWAAGVARLHFGHSFGRIRLQLGGGLVQVVLLDVLAEGCCFAETKAQMPKKHEFSVAVAACSNMLPLRPLGNSQDSMVSLNIPHQPSQKYVVFLFFRTNPLFGGKPPPVGQRPEARACAFSVDLEPGLLRCCCFV